MVDGARRCARALVGTPVPAGNGAATEDDGSCAVYWVSCGDSGATNYQPDAAAFDDALCRFGGCTDPTAANYHSAFAESCARAPLGPAGRLPERALRKLGRVTGFRAL